jgi:hypothetical protein
VERRQDGVAQRFVDDLNQLRQRAGQPSYSTLERLSGHRLKRATMSDVLNGNRVKVPDWRFIHEFVTALPVRRGGKQARSRSTRDGRRLEASLGRSG